MVLQHRLSNAAPCHNAINGCVLHCGTCGGCELELQALFRRACLEDSTTLQFAAAPEEAQVLFVTGCATWHSAAALQRAALRLQQPRLIIAVGTCAVSGGVFRQCCGVLGGADAVIPVDTFIAGCPPRPQTIQRGVAGLLRALAKAEMV